MGKLVEAVAHVPRHRGSAYVELAAEPAVCRRVASEVSRGEMLEKLVARSPTAEIEIGGVPVGCVLDTGAETSLMPSSFYHEHLTGMVGGLRNVGTFMKIVGVNDLSVPVEGYLDVPISIFGHTMMASFFVKQDTTMSVVGRRVEHP